MHKDKKLTLNNNTVASNPGKIKFNEFVWVRYHFKMPVIIYFSLFISIILVIKFSLYFLFLFMFLVFIHEIYWTKHKEHFTADSNGGIIVSKSPPLAAVYTNLASYGDNYPAIKIIEFKVNRPINIGEKIATVATYSGSHDKNHWDDFYPLPVEYATKNQEQINAELESYSQEHWQSLENGIKQLKRPYELGLFKIEEKNSEWAELN